MQRFSSIIAEGKHDPSIFKAIFLAGGPGSGKTFVTRQLGLPALGFKTINSDTAFEAALKKAGLQPSPDDIYSDQGQLIRQRSKVLTSIQQKLALKGRLGLVLDGTGKDYHKIALQKAQLEAVGYETLMLFVNTNLTTAINRNRTRSRSLPDTNVEKMWYAVQDNIGKFQQLFRRNFVVVDNSDTSDVHSALKSAYKQVRTFAESEPHNPRAQEWIREQ